MRRALPSILHDDDIPWFRRESRHWTCYQDFLGAFQLEYCVGGRQERLKREVENRTQGPHESISQYLGKLRMLLDAVRPVMPLSERLQRAYRNLHPRYRDRIPANRIRTFADLQTLGKEEELRMMQNKAYKPPPPPEESEFPAAAYIDPMKPRRLTRAAPIASTPAARDALHR